MKFEPGDVVTWGTGKNSFVVRTVYAEGLRFYGNMHAYLPFSYKFEILTSIFRLYFKHKD